MADTWSGAIIYEWIQETNKYGLVDYALSQGAPAGDGAYGVNGTPIARNPDFSNLGKHWATLTPSGIRADDYKPTLSPPACPDFTTSAWQVKADAPLPTIGYGDKASSSSSSSLDVPTSLATASGMAHPENGAPVETSTGSSAGTTAASTAGATSKAAARGTFEPLMGARFSLEMWLVGYVALCAVAGMFVVL
jgi:hypothetical protein